MRLFDWLAGKRSNVQILPDRVIVEERHQESKGKEKSHRVALKLHKEEGEGRP